ncbi:Cyclin family protein [Rhynchospora pubera]|uniref:Cyclin family protein n=1 Tax=Rhynchospora pubera TaxID=906938 RepID=A0AAV8DXA6_9POAL|nr:Cyclin family protein [Rhynchospora pubera]
MCSLYADDIYTNNCKIELDERLGPSPDYLESMQSGITPEMRATLVDWMVKVCDDYRFSSDTLYLAVYVVDSFLSKSKIERKQLLLLGTTCILIASKYVERQFKFKPVGAGQLCMDAKSTKAEVIKMESQVLTSVGFHISVPTCNTFLRRYLQVAHASSEIIQPALEHMACYLAELALASYYFLRHLPSKVAASAVFVAKWILDPSSNIWDKRLADATGYDSQQLMDCVLQLRNVYQNSNGARFIRMKYQKVKKQDEMIPDWEEPNKEVTGDNNSLSVSAEENWRKDVQDNTRETHFSAEGCNFILPDSGPQAETNGNHFSADGCDSNLRDFHPQYNTTQGGSTKNEKSSAWWTGRPVDLPCLQGGSSIDLDLTLRPPLPGRPGVLPCLQGGSSIDLDLTLRPPMPVLGQRNLKI